ncbi:MAG: hypothetical protein GF334_03550, partial [Candidatus Altiarchaeales archaeon]|nr:hypothetical protein [Candidatus Altiarchaeales archaeon]
MKPHPASLIFLVTVLLFSGCINMDTYHKIKRTGRSDLTVSISGNSVLVNMFKNGVTQDSFDNSIKNKVSFDVRDTEKFQVKCIDCAPGQLEAFWRGFNSASKNMSQTNKPSRDYSGLFFTPPNMNETTYKDGFFQGVFTNSGISELSKIRVNISNNQQSCLLSHDAPVQRYERFQVEGRCFPGNPREVTVIIQSNSSFAGTIRPKKSTGKITFK